MRSDRFVMTSARAAVNIGHPDLHARATMAQPLRRMLAALAAIATALPAAGHAACDVRSGPATAALVELYTSEGCSSCPPADRQLSLLAEELAAGDTAVPLALHVSYWDAIGWKDPYAQDVFTQRQRRLVHSAGDSTVYTPHFFIGGRALRDWRGEIGNAVRRINARPAQADIGLRAQPSADGKLLVQADAASRTPSAVLYLAVAESGLTSKVTRGENGGTTLAHDHVARLWHGPLPLQGGRIDMQQAFELPAQWRRERLSVVAFVQDERSGTVLQALGATGCTLR